jgi:hypothetical protein
MGKLLTSLNTAKQLAEVKPAPLDRGPKTGEPLKLTPLMYCVKYAIAEEWADFEKTVRARVDNEPKQIFEKCSKCGLVFARAYRAPAGRPCVTCNWPGYADGGFMVQMKAIEVKKWQAEQRSRRAVESERQWKAGLTRHNEDRAKRGLDPDTLDVFKAKRIAENELGRRRDRVIAEPSKQRTAEKGA